jgi:peptidoglycan hydrolase-like amidase
VLEVPGVIRRAYTGTVEIFSEDGFVAPVVTMDCECATGSIVGAELPVERCAHNGLAAQAVVSRSILCAATRPRHNFADFCDTTHCQFLRSPAAASSRVWQATQESKGVVLFQQGRIFPARYSAACGGRTEDGTDGDFRYVAVDCAVCRRDGNVRRGHGWGLCQEGAMRLAPLGCTWREILSHYYPDSHVSHESLRLL